MRASLLWLISFHSAAAGLSNYSDLVVADRPNQVRRSHSVRVTYLGTNGYQLETAGHAILIDPYFSRISLPRAALGWPVRPDQARIDQELAHLHRDLDAVLVTHAHFDHLLDAPTVMKRTDARLVASATAVELAARAGADRSKCQAVEPGMVRNIGPWQIRAFRASHDRVPIIGVPFDGPLKKRAPPKKAGDWVCGEPLSFLITANGLRIFVDSGGTPALLPPADIGPVDLAILGVALPDSRQRFAAAVTRLRPRYVLPSHQDNFFIPLSRGFQFAPLTDFGFVRREYQNRHLPGQLILLDYFRPWTVPLR